MVNELNKDWITEGILDAEYKKYLMLAYLQFVSKNFEEYKLYPPLARLIDHFHSLSRLREEKDYLEKGFKKELKAIDLKALNLIFESFNDNQLLEYIEEMIDFALPRFKQSIEKGKDLYEWVDEHLVLESVGLLPLYKREGFLFLHTAIDDKIAIFRYHHSIIQSNEDAFGALKTQFLTFEHRTISKSFQNLKLHLIKQFKDLPNPAVYLMSTPLMIPLRETLLPVTKRKLLLTLQDQKST